MNKPLSELLNIGIPVYNPLDLNIFDMTLKCSDHVSKTISLEREIRQEAIDRVDKIVGNKSANRKTEYLSTINFSANKESISVFGLTKKQRLINIFENMVDIEQIDGITDKEVLSKIKDCLIDLSYEVMYIKNKPYTKAFYNDIKKYYSPLYNGKDGQDLRSYLEYEYNYYDLVSKRISEINNITYSDLLDDYTSDLNPEKLALFIAGNYMNEIYNALDNADIRAAQESLFYISAFIKKKIDKSIKISLPGRDEISYDMIKREFLYLLEDYSYLKDVYLKRSFFEHKELDFNKSMIDNIINMKDIKISGKLINPGERKDTKHGDVIHRRKAPTEDELKQIEEYLQYKYYIYLKNKPLAQITGEEYFSNYIAFLYENGMMPADRLLNVNTVSEMKADSIYVFDASTFDEMKNKNKTFLRKNSEIKPLNHSGDWEDRLQRIIEMDTSDELKEKAKELVKKNKTYKSFKKC